MRPAPVLAALTLALAVARPGDVLAAPELRVVAVPRAEVRSGPSEKFYVTLELQRGTPVEVVGEQNGWVKIVPPEGSFSWINTRFLSQPSPNQPTQVTMAPELDVPVYAGSRVMNARPDVVSTRVKRGTLVVGIGPTRADGEGAWLPVLPHITEFRYIHPSALNNSGAPGNPAGTQVARDRSTFSPGPLAPSAAPSAALTAAPDSLWQRAVEAERAGRTADAVELYARVGADTARSDPTRSAEALQRARYLQAGQRESPTQVRAYPSPVEGTTIPRSPAISAPAQTTSLSRSESAPTIPRGAPGQAWRAYSGRLRNAGRSVDDRPTYVLELRSVPVMYVTPQAGLNLDSYVERNVELTGWVGYRGELRAYLINAVQVNPLP